MTWGREAGILQGVSFVCWEDFFVSSANLLSYFDERAVFMLDIKASLYTYFSCLLAAAQRKGLESLVSNSAPCHLNAS
jgi:hypothetical protein